MKRIILCMTIFVMAAVSALAAPIEIEWWHAMGGRLGEKVNLICEDFNKSQTQYKIVPVFKGSYAETMTAGIAAYRAGKAPHILQVYEVGTATMMAAKGAIKPVYQLMAETGEPFNPQAYLPAVTGYYTTPDGRMLSLPFNSSTPVLYYNKDGFKKAGLDPNKPPKTWPEVAEYARKLIAAGYPSGFSTAWTSWIQLENYSAWHNVPSGTLKNGFGGLETELLLNRPLQVRHIQQLADWQKDKIFVYGGRTNAGNAKFSGEEVAMHTESSAGYAGFKSTCKFEFGVSMLPYWPDVKGAPQNTIIGGASLWVMSGRNDAEYKGVAKFFAYLSKPEVQADWHQFSGYLPITTAAYELSKKQGFYDKNPGTDISIKQITLNPPTDNSKGIRYGNMSQIRDIVDQQLEEVFAGKLTAQQGLDEVVRQGNILLRNFERMNK
ncbi:MAG: sn-glycerol-3-phosphate ABC transporter substrate-binding protein UgpB [Spirochaetota bacterium]